MKKWKCGGVLIGLLLAGCQDPGSDSPEKAITAEVPATPSEGLSGGEGALPDGDLILEENATEEKWQVVLDETFLAGLAENQVKGCPISIGSRKQEVIDRFGSVREKGFYDGGQYHAFEHLAGGIVFFDGQDRVYAFDLTGDFLNTSRIDEVKKQLGKPTEEGVNQVDGGWFLLYQAGDNMLILDAADAQSPIEKIRVINKKMVEENPQKF